MKYSLILLFLIQSIYAQNFTQFASDEDHSFSFNGQSIINNLSNLNFIPNAELKKSDWPTPVIFDDNIIYGTKDSLIVSYNLIENKINWKLDLKGFKLHSAPIINIQNKKLYFLTSKWEEIKFKKYKFNIRLKINEVGLDSKDFNSFEIDQDKYTTNQSAIKLNYASHCKNALGILKNTKGDFLYWGCSMYTDPNIGLNYRQGKGLTGIEYFVELNKNGNLNFKNIFTFSPSKITSNPNSGFDTGIWNTGSKAINLKDGTILISTGNGPVIPKENNYGCSVIRLDTNNFKIRNYLSADTTENKECEYSGLDFSSSSINISKYIKNSYAFTVNKAGNLWIFDPFNFDNEKIQLKYKFASHSYGTPISFLNKKNKLQVVAIGYDLHSVHPPIEFIAPAEFKTKLSNYKIGKCVGYLPIDKTSKSKINLYYSGPELNDFILSNKQMPFYKFGFREYSITNASIAYKKLSQIEIDKLKLIEKHAYMQSYNDPSNLSEIIGLQITNDEFKNNQLIYADYDKKDDFFYYQLSNQNCDKEITGMTKLYKFQQEIFNSEINETNIVSFELINKKWTKKYEIAIPRLRPHNSNYSLIKGEQNLILFSAYNTLKTEKDSTLLFFDTETGKIIKTYQYEGVGKFAMPIVHKSSIFIPTQRDGLLQLSVKTK